MSLLLKALQRASKNREGLQQDALPDARGGLAIELEPGEIEPPRAPRRDPDSGVRNRGSLGGTVRPEEPEDLSSGNVREERFDAMEWVRDHPVHLFAGAALLFLIGYFIYVYIAISNPAFFAGGGANREAAAVAAKPAAAPQAPRPEAVRPEPPAPAPMPAVDTSPLQAQEGPPPVAAAATPAAGVPRAGSAPVEAGVVQTAPPARLAPIAPDGDSAVAPRPRRSPRTPPGSTDQSSSADSRGRAPEAPLQEGVRIQPTEAGTVTQARLSEAYDALQRRDLERARALYESVIVSDDRNIDGLLGLAATSWQQGQADRAADQYYRVLQLDPQNAAAQAGLIGLSGQVDPVASETRLKQLISRDPSALLYASLGHLYAAQSQWSNAQQAYFQAHQLEPSNPDYAYNLAVGLEHVGQRGIAIGYYRKALDLARSRGQAGFDPAQVAARVAKLSAAVE